MGKKSSQQYLDELFESIQEYTLPLSSVNTDKDALPESSLESAWDDKFKEETLHNLRQDRSQRKEYADEIYTFLCVYMICVFLIILACGKRNVCFVLSDTVLVALITTTTANVIGIFVFVVKYLFNPK